MSQSNLTVASVVQRTGILTAAGTVFDEDSSAVGLIMQNLGTNPLFVKFGASASTSDFDLILPAATGSDNGTGGAQQFPLGGLTAGTTVSVAGTSPRFTMTRFYERRLNS